MNNTILLPNTVCFAQNINAEFKRCFQEKRFLVNSKIQETGSFSDQQHFLFNIYVMINTSQIPVKFQQLSKLLRMNKTPHF